MYKIRFLYEYLYTGCFQSSADCWSITGLMRNCDPELHWVTFMQNKQIEKLKTSHRELWFSPTAGLAQYLSNKVLKLKHLLNVWPCLSLGHLRCLKFLRKVVGRWLFYSQECHTVQVASFSPDLGVCWVLELGHCVSSTPALKRYSKRLWTSLRHCNSAPQRGCPW